MTQAISLIVLHNYDSSKSIVIDELIPVFPSHVRLIGKVRLNSNSHGLTNAAIMRFHMPSHVNKYNTLSVCTVVLEHCLCF